MNIEINERQALMLVTALGVLKDRVGQKGKWLTRKRMPTLRHRLADCITIADTDEQEGVRKAMRKTQDEIDRRIRFGEEVADFMNAIKQQAGITDERFKDFNYTRPDGTPTAESDN